ncbi:MAG: methylamine utilization protein [Pseudomonadota bacterium]
MELGTAFHTRALASVLALALPTLGIQEAAAARLDLRVVAVDGSVLAGTVVVVRSTNSSRPPATPTKGVMDQMNREFVPHVLIVPVGSRVTFPNSDTVSHQIYSFSPAKKFQFPLYRGSPNPPVDFDRAGVVTIGCNIHDQMRAYVFVVDGQYYGRTDTSGAWNAADVEPGEYTVLVWHPLSREMRPIIEQQVRVTDASAGTSLTLRVATPLKLRAESTVPANWDAY